MTWALSVFSKVMRTSAIRVSIALCKASSLSPGSPSSVAQVLIASSNHERACEMR